MSQSNFKNCGDPKSENIQILELKGKKSSDWLNHLNAARVYKIENSI